MKENILSEQYKKGFNHGFIINKYREEIYKGIQVQTRQASDYIQGFYDGGKQVEYDKMQDRLNDLNYPPSDKSQDKGVDR